MFLTLNIFSKNIFTKKRGERPNSQNPPIKNFQTTLTKHLIQPNQYLFYIISHNTNYSKIIIFISINVEEKPSKRSHPCRFFSCLPCAKTHPSTMSFFHIFSFFSYFIFSFLFPFFSFHSLFSLFLAIFFFLLFLLYARPNHPCQLPSTSVMGPRRPLLRPFPSPPATP